jgi:hypothetical protein
LREIVKAVAKHIEEKIHKDFFSLTQLDIEEKQVFFCRIEILYFGEKLMLSGKGITNKKKGELSAAFDFFSFFFRVLYGAFFNTEQV